MREGEGKGGRGGGVLGGSGFDRLMCTEVPVLSQAAVMRYHWEYTALSVHERLGSRGPFTIEE